MPRAEIPEPLELFLKSRPGRKKRPCQGCAVPPERWAEVRKGRERGISWAVLAEYLETRHGHVGLKGHHLSHCDRAGHPRSREC